jgi:uncharacterized caspase-like protein
MRNRAFIFVLAFAALVELTGCAGPRIEKSPWPMLDSAALRERLAIDGLWRFASETQPAKYRLDAGRMYLYSDFDSEGRFGMLLYRAIEQIGPRSFACEKLVRVGDRSHWGTCELSLEVDGILIEESAAVPELDIEAAASLLHPVEPDDPKWFRAQRTSYELVSRAEAHRPPARPRRPPPLAIEVPTLPPTPPPTEVVHSVPKREATFGPYRALVIGVGDYLYLPAVDTAEGDADAVASLLEERYDFEVTNLRNPGREQLLAALAELQEDLAPKDNLLIYYSGHGWLSDIDGRCYWFPVDALEDDSSNWVANQEITQHLKATKAKHIMVVADSCYTGGQPREVGLSENGRDRHSRLAEKRARVVLTSGGLEPVQAADGGDHSVFTRAFLDVLRDNEGVLDGTSLYSQIQDIVSSGAIQTPEYIDLREAEHDGGDFLFVAEP